MFWENEKKIRFLDECLAILDFIRKWLLRHYYARLQSDLQSKSISYNHCTNVFPQVTYKLYS